MSGVARDIAGFSRSSRSGGKCKENKNTRNEHSNAVGLIYHVIVGTAENHNSRDGSSRFCVRVCGRH